MYGRMTETRGWGFATFKSVAGKESCVTCRTRRNKNNQTRAISPPTHPLLPSTSTISLLLMLSRPDHYNIIMIFDWRAAEMLFFFFLFRFLSWQLIWSPARRFDVHRDQRVVQLILRPAATTRGGYFSLDCDVPGDKLYWRFGWFFLRGRRWSPCGHRFVVTSMKRQNDSYLPAAITAPSSSIWNDASEWTDPLVLLFTVTLLVL